MSSPSLIAPIISIHAPREGGDRLTMIAQAETDNFNPRPPRGGRLSWPDCLWLLHQFQSTPPARGATPRAVFIRTR